MQAVFPGKPQAKLQAISIGLWEGKQIITYISGNALVILGGPVEVLQTIYHETEDELEAVTIDESSGKIATCSLSEVYIYEPSKLRSGSPKWSLQTKFTLKASGDHISTLSWGISDELLIGSSSLTLFSAITSSDGPVQTWTRTLSSPAKIAHFSPDASLIASTARYDRMVKIWRRLIFSSYETAPAAFDWSYLRHPRTVTALNWRKARNGGQQDDNVLYTICVDNKLRVWTTPANGHALHILELWTEIDLVESIKPRNLHTEASGWGTRYAFVVDGRDFAHAAEIALQESDNAEEKKEGHALAHLAEVANRNPELVVVLDGRGSMSAWGLESVGCKARKRGDVFNVAHVDGFPIRFSAVGDENTDEKHVQFVNFPARGGDGVLTVLVHRFGRAIDWWEGNIEEVLDLERRPERVKLKATWTGHKNTVTNMVKSGHGRALASWTTSGEATVWLQKSETPGMTLVENSRVPVWDDIRGMSLLQNGNYVVLLQDRISLWDARRSKAAELAFVDHQLHGRPICISPLPEATSPSGGIHIITVTTELKGVVWKVHLPLENGMTNGYTEHPDATIEEFCSFDFDSEDIIHFVPVDSVPSGTVAPGFLATRPKCTALSWTESGRLTSWSAKIDTKKRRIEWVRLSSVDTGILNPSIAAASSLGHTALVNTEKAALSIWDMKNAHREYEERFNDQDTVRDLKWTSTPDGYSILAVCFAHHVLIYAQTLYDYTDNQPAWRQIREVNISECTPHPICDAAWLDDGYLVIGSGNQLYLCKNEVQIDSSVEMPPSSRVSTLSSHEKGSKNILELVKELNCALPLWHPQFLFQSIQAGRISLVHRILVSLHKLLKFYTEGDEIDPLLGISPEEVFDERTSTATLTNGDNYSSNHVDSEPERLSEDIASSLNAKLTETQLPYLSKKEQSLLSNIIGCVGKIEKHSTSIDDNALRFLLSFWMKGMQAYGSQADHSLANGTVSKPSTARRASEIPLVGWREICWAWRSSSQDVLLDLVSRQFSGKVTWEKARSAGISCWMADVNALRAQFEIIARNEYTKTEERNPVDCSLYYLALRKKNVLQGLWRMATWSREQAATQRLLSNNFQDPRWKTAALKNAYALMGKRRFEYAAAFFLLAGNLKDAVGVLAGQMGDVQLAVAVARVYEGDAGPVLRAFLEEKVIPGAVRSGDRWCVAWAWGLMGRRELAMRAIVAPLNALLPTQSSSEPPIPAPSFRTEDPSLVQLYLQLRDSKPHSLNGVPKTSQSRDQEQMITPREEWEFVMKHVRLYLRMGCALLALDLVRNFTFLPTPLHAPSATEPTTGTVPATPTPTHLLTAPLPDGTTPAVLKDKETKKEKEKLKPPPKETFQEPSASSLLDAFGF